MATETRLPGGFLLVDHGLRVCLYGPTPDSSVPFGGRLEALAHPRRVGDRQWTVRSRRQAMGEVADRAAAVQWLTKYAAGLQVDAQGQGPGLD